MIYNSQQLNTRRSVNIYKKKKECTKESKEHILDLITYCRKIRPFALYYNDQTNSFNHTAQNIWKNEIGLRFAKIHRKQ